MVKKNYSGKSLIVWALLWVLGVFLIGIRNDLTLMGQLSSPVEILVANGYINFFLIPIVVLLWFVMKLILKISGKSEVLQGSKSIRNTFFIWLVLFGIVFMYGVL